MISFKGSHYPKDIVLYAVYFYVRYAVSYRDLEEIMAESGVDVDHATLNRWVVKYSPLIAAQAQRRKSKANSSWCMDETYIKVKGKIESVEREARCLCELQSDRIERRINPLETLIVKVDLGGDQLLARLLLSFRLVESLGHPPELTQQCRLALPANALPHQNLVALLSICLTYRRRKQVTLISPTRKNTVRGEALLRAGRGQH